METQITAFARRFTEIHDRSVTFVNSLPEEKLFVRPGELHESMAMFSCGEYVLRSAAAVEQTVGGITTRLWDDPFEWTLPEKLSTRDKVIEYLNEVEVARDAAFEFFGSDDDLKKLIPAPRRMRSIFELLLETVARAEHYQGRAFAVSQMLCDKKLPRLKY